jgi:hypothetical protein
VLRELPIKLREGKLIMKQLSEALPDINRKNEDTPVIQPPGSTRNAGVMKSTTTTTLEWKADLERVNSIKHTHGSWLVARYDDDYRLLAYKIPRDISVTRIRAAYTELAAHIEPLNDRQIAKALIRLKSLTISRHEKDGDLDLQMEAYAERLRKYPGSAVYAAMGDLVETSKWFPAWAELKDAIMVHCQHTMKAVEAMEVRIDDRPGIR